MLFAGLLIAGPAASQDGDLDTTFDGDGIVLAAANGGDHEGRAVAVDGIGRIVVVGHSGSGLGTDIVVMRLGPDGSPDVTFGNNGAVVVDITGVSDQGRTVAIQPDGRILVAGRTNSLDPDMCLLRFTDAGALDATFGTNGISVTDFAVGCVANAMVLQPDGRIVLAGYSNFIDPEFTVVRFMPDGTLDTSFGTDGQVITGFGNQSDLARALAIQPDGKLIAGGMAFIGPYQEFALVRYNTDGSLDNSFGTGGLVNTLIGEPFISPGFGTVFDPTINDLTVLPDGRIVAAGFTYDADSMRVVALARYEADGSLDATFGTGGMVVTDIGAEDDEGAALAVQPDGELLVTGRSATATSLDLVLLRYHPDGTLDNTFDGDGIRQVDVGNADDVGASVTLQADGRIVVAGTSGTLGSRELLVARFLSGLNIGVYEMPAIATHAFHPNPASDMLILTGGHVPGTRVRFTNALGQVVFEAAAIGGMSVDVSGWSAGQYVATFTTPDGSAWSRPLQVVR